MLREVLVIFMYSVGGGGMNRDEGGEGEEGGGDGGKGVREWNPDGNNLFYSHYAVLCNYSSVLRFDSVPVYSSGRTRSLSEKSTRGISSMC